MPSLPVVHVSNCLRAWRSLSESAAAALSSTLCCAVLPIFPLERLLSPESDNLTQLGILVTNDCNSRTGLSTKTHWWSKKMSNLSI